MQKIPLQRNHDTAFCKATVGEMTETMARQSIANSRVEPAMDFQGEVDFF